MRAAILSVCLYLFVGGCAEDESCTLAGCAPIAVLDVGPITPDLVANTALHVCINDACMHGFVPASATGGVSAAGELSNGELHGRVTVRGADDGVHVEIEAPRQNELAAADGDTYSVTIVDEHGTVVAARSWTATYYQLAVNHDSDGDPCSPVCTYAELRE